MKSVEAFECQYCKTEGLVWHDRYKMILDCNRKLDAAYKTIRRAN